jgi:hypothetical protein
METLVTFSSGDPNVFLMDPRSGTQLGTAKNNLTGPGGVAFVRGNGSRDVPAEGYMVTTQSNKPSLHVWAWPLDKDQLYLR